MISATDSAHLPDLLSRRIYKQEVLEVAHRCAADPAELEALYRLTCSSDQRRSVNALRCLSHVFAPDFLHSKQNELIDRLLGEQHVPQKRILLSLLRDMEYTAETVRADFLDYCFSKINAECEPYAVRCFSLYCAFKMCRFYPELIGELDEYLNMLSTQTLSPGLKSALRTTRKNMAALRSRQKICKTRKN